mmetsp:Transcript_16675/g.14584  ORF Transcript_16675/g.14584 Transcript_16675/m.14584 type:complete len:159 (+) Transcript_16675:497-973(+)
MGTLATHGYNFNFIRIKMLLPVIPAVFQLIMLYWYFTKETPKFYILTEKFIKARESSKLILNTDEGCINSNSSHNSSSIVNSDSSSEFRVSLCDNNFGGRDYSSLLKPIYYRPFLVGLMLSALQQLSFINIIIVFSNKFKTLDDDSRILTLSIGTINF